MNRGGMKDQPSVIYTAGTWDLFHLGHLRMLQRVRQMATTMIVGVSTDQLVAEYKTHTPYDTFDCRYTTICSVSGADIVIPQIRQFDLPRMLRLGVTCVVMGDDWAGSERPELKLLQEHIEVRFLPRTEGISSSILKTKLGS